MSEDVRERIMSKFEESPGQRAVVELLLERGFSVNDEARVVSGGIEIPYTQIADEAEVDRRVVDSTADAILQDQELRDIFQNISSIPSLRDVAPVLGLSVLTIRVEDAASTGVVAEIARVIADEGVSIRQAVTDDPYFADEPRFTVITNGEVSGTLIKRLSELDFVEKVNLLSP
jgi:predicted regulator of amino acid metabolism with ACT domain